MTEKELLACANALQKKAVQIWESNEVVLTYEFDPIGSVYQVGLCFPKDMSLSMTSIRKFLDYCEKKWGKDCPMMKATIRTKNDYGRKNFHEGYSEFNNRFLCWQDKELSRFLLYNGDNTELYNPEQTDSASKHFAYVLRLLDICRETIPDWSDNKLRKNYSKYDPDHVRIGFETTMVPFRNVMEFYQKCSNVLGPDCPVAKYGDFHLHDDYRYMFEWDERTDLWFRTADKIGNNILKSAKILDITRVRADTAQELLPSYGDAAL